MSRRGFTLLEMLLVMTGLGVAILLGTTALLTAWRADVPPLRPGGAAPPLP
jgi:prepilin-type N-terminal cleavage/methylation domain-containing protein